MESCQPGTACSVPARLPDGCYREGFRMPAGRDLSTRAEGRRPKASEERTRGKAVSALGRLWGFGVGAAVVGEDFAKTAGRCAPLITAESSLLRRWMA